MKSSSPTPKTSKWPLPAGLLALAALVFAVAAWQKPANEADTRVGTARRDPAPQTPPPTREEAQAILRELLTAVETDGLAVLAKINPAWPDSLRRSLRRDLLEHHGIQNPLESLEWLANHPHIEGSGPLGVELSSSLHARAGHQAGSMEPWQTALGRLDRIAAHGTAREHLAYLQSALLAMRSTGEIPFNVREIHAMPLRPHTKAVALASLGDLRAGLDLLEPGGPDFAAAHLATREWLTFGRLPLSFTETANRLLTLAPPGGAGPADVARSLRHPSLDRSIALWLRNHPATPARDELLNEIAADLSRSDPSFAQAILQTSHPD